MSLVSPLISSSSVSREASEAARSVGYDVLINSDEETGSLSSAALIAELAAAHEVLVTVEDNVLTAHPPETPGGPPDAQMPLGHRPGARGAARRGARR